MAYEVHDIKMFFVFFFIQNTQFIVVFFGVHHVQTLNKIYTINNKICIFPSFFSDYKFVGNFPKCSCFHSDTRLLCLIDTTFIPLKLRRVRTGGPECIFSTCLSVKWWLAVSCPSFPRESDDEPNTTTAVETEVDDFICERRRSFCYARARARVFVTGGNFAADTPLPRGVWFFAAARGK